MLLVGLVQVFPEVHADDTAVMVEALVGIVCGVVPPVENCVDIMVRLHPLLVPVASVVAIASVYVGA